MSDLSDRLADAKRKLGISTQKMSDLAQDAGYQLSNYSATVYTNGKHPAKASAATLEALAYVLRVPLAELRELAGLPQQHGKFEPAPEADSLTAPQRAAVNEIIRLLADGNTGAGESNGSPMSDAGGTPATEEERLATDFVASKRRQRSKLRPLPDLETMAADESGETELQRLDRESADRDHESQDPEDWR